MPGIYEGIPLTLILDGKIQERTLDITGKDKAWLAAQLKRQGISEASCVLVALLDTQGNLLIQEKGESGGIIRAKVLEPDEVRW